jgi:hypothetical protein
VRAYGFPSIIMGLKSPSLKSGHHDLFFLRCMRAPYWRVVTRGCCCCIKEISDLSFEKWDCCLGGSSSSIGVGLLPWEDLVHPIKNYANVTRKTSYQSLGVGLLLWKDQVHSLESEVIATGRPILSIGKWCIEVLGRPSSSPGE